MPVIHHRTRKGGCKLDALARGKRGRLPAAASTWKMQFSAGNRERPPILMDRALGARLIGIRGGTLMTNFIEIAGGEPVAVPTIAYTTPMELAVNGAVKEYDKTANTRFAGRNFGILDASSSGSGRA